MTQISQLLKRVYLFLEDGEFDKAEEYCERILDEDPECAEAYLCKLCVDLKVYSPENLSSCIIDFECNKNYQKVLRFGDENIISKLNSYLSNAKQNFNNEIARRNLEILQQNQYILDKKQKWVERRKAIAPFKSLIDECDGRISGIDVNGNVIGWGAVKHDKDVSGWSDMKSICDSSYVICGLKHNGSVISTGDSSIPKGYICGWDNITEIAYDGTKCAGLRADGTVAIIGWNGAGEDFRSIQLWNDIVSVCAGYDSFLGLKSNGTVVAVHSNSNPYVNHENCNVQRWRDIVEITSTGSHSLGLKTDGTVVAAGYIPRQESKGILDVQRWKDIVSVSAGSSHSVGLKMDGTVVATGNNDYGQCNVACWKNVVAIKASHKRTIGLLEDGSVITTGSKSNTIYTVPGMKLFDNYLTFEEERKKIQEEKIQIKKEQAIRRQQNVCQYCGGTFKGLLFKSCSKCGSPKDY